MEYKCRGIVTVNDYVQFNKTHSKNSFWGKYKWIFLPVIFIVSFISEWTDIIPQVLNLEAVFATKYSFILLFVLILVFVLIKLFLVPFFCRRHYRENKMIKDFTTYTITAQTISINWESGNTTISKDKISKIKFDGDSIYIYIALNMAYIIKKHFFDNETEYHECVEFVKTNYCK